MVLAVLVSSGIAGGAVYVLTPRHSTTPVEPAAVGEPVAGPHTDAHPDGHAAAAEKTAKKGGATYLPMSPAFVVNLADTDNNRFLQVEMEAMTHESWTADALSLHMPQVRNSLLMLLGQQNARDLETREGKQALQKKVLEEIQRILTAETGHAGVDAVYFTSFVIQ